MISAWMAFSLVVEMLVAGAALGVERALRLAAWPSRWAWVAGLGLTLALVALAPLRLEPAPPVQVASVPVLTSIAPISTRSRQPQAAWRIVSVAAAGQLRGFIAAAGDRVPPGIQPWLAGAWAAASLVSLLILAGTQRRVRRLRRSWPRAELDGERVRLSPSTGPAVVGLRHPEIVAPRWLLELPASERRLVLAHEREHVRARDPLLLVAGCVAAALLPWHPVSWWMLARLRLAVELDCDARVLRHELDRRSYGTLLIDLAGRSSGSRIGFAAIADEPTHLERRLLAMTTPRTRHPAARVLALGGASLLALFVACEAKLPTAADVAKLDVAGAQAIVHATMPQGKTTFLVDGREVTEAEARAIDPRLIEAMQIQRRSGQSSLVSVQSRKAREESKAEAMADVTAGINDAVVLIDGKRADLATYRGLAAADIEVVRVIKDREQAVRQFGPAAANGLVLVTTKSRPRGGPVANGSLRLDGNGLTRDAISAILGRQPVQPTLFLVDGAITDRAALDAIPEGEAWGVMVLHAPFYSELYGPEAEKGVVQVQTKTGSAEQYQRFKSSTTKAAAEGVK